MARFEISAENYIPQPGDAIVGRFITGADTFVQTTLTIERPSLVEPRRLVYRFDPTFRNEGRTSSYGWFDEGPIKPSERASWDRPIGESGSGH